MSLFTNKYFTAGIQAECNNNPICDYTTYTTHDFFNISIIVGILIIIALIQNVNELKQYILALSDVLNHSPQTKPQVEGLNPSADISKDEAGK